MVAENLQFVVDTVALGDPDGARADKKNTMPSSYIGGHRYMAENFHGAVAASRGQASPDIFTTFACDPKWPEISRNIDPHHNTADRADIITRVYHMKLLEYLQKIKSGKIFRAVLVGDVPVAHTVEFQKNGLPHAHILVWQKKDNDEVITPDFSSSFVSTMGSELSDVDDDAPATALIKAMESALAEPPGLKTLFCLHIEAQCLGPRYFRPRF